MNDPRPDPFEIAGPRPKILVEGTPLSELPVSAHGSYVKAYLDYRKQYERDKENGKPITEGRQKNLKRKLMEAVAWANYHGIPLNTFAKVE